MNRVENDIQAFIYELKKDKINSILNSDNLGDAGDSIEYLLELSEFCLAKGFNYD